ncbi:MAG: mucoidy inhibitor MuiA family protein, partial [Bacteroidetes bacterium]|nr:mucoidy inhibitor MuiA family protein [Bacteroidota bacterium]
MKNLFLFFLYYFSVVSAFGQTSVPAKPQLIASKIEKVTVFLTGGQVTRTGRASIPTGRSELVFKDVSPNIDKQSIQVKGDGAFSILSVNHQLNHLQEQVRREEITKLEVEKYRLNGQQKLQAANLGICKQEEAILQKNQSVAGQQNGISAAELVQVVDFRRKRWTELTMQQLEIANKMARTDSILAKLDKQLTALNQQKDLATSEIIVAVSAKTATEGKFELSYYVKDAGWFATYDLRVKDVTSPIDLAFKANVRQSSGEDWKDVRLTISSGDPTTNAESQELMPWHLRFGYLQPLQVAYQGGLGRGGITQVSGRVMDESGEPLIGATIVLKGTSMGTITDIDGSYTFRIPPNPATLVVSYTGYATQEVPVNGVSINIALTSGLNLEEVVVTRNNISGSVAGVRKQKKSRDDKTIPLETTETYQPTTVNFEIEIPYTIPSDGKTYMVDIKSETVPTHYEYFAAPKLDEHAYLTAHVTDWQDLNLMDGEVNLFFEGAFLGRSLLDTKNATDTLD